MVVFTSPEVGVRSSSSTVYFRTTPCWKTCVTTKVSLVLNKKENVNRGLYLIAPDYFFGKIQGYLYKIQRYKHNIEWLYSLSILNINTIEKFEDEAALRLLDSQRITTLWFMENFKENKF